ncbi:MAG: HAMP domain-containing histidine kinase [Muribaculaceae bacterium]|nr:HAMP domain-containing histidine kinase [Muribaculaceae bacterium]
MKKSLMWMLTGVMSIAFVALLYFQIMYLDKMVQMREEQFTEGVMRSLNTTADFLERQETRYFLEQDVNIIESSLYDDFDSDSKIGDDNLEYSVSGPDGSVRKYTLSSDIKNQDSENLSYAEIGYSAPTQNIGSRYGAIQEVIRSQYLYQKGLLNEVILSILRDSSMRPASERADSTMIRTCLESALKNNGLNVPFAFSVTTAHNDLLYATQGFKSVSNDLYSIPLFAHTETKYSLNVYFPDKQNYIFKSVRFVIPTLALTVILLVIFLYTLILAFRQKNLSEMKNDFINNMTHELKTPISTISLAGQMLSEPSIQKSSASLDHLAEVIVDESKRLRFQVEKVLQLSVLDKTESTLKFTEVNANSIIYNVVNTFKLKVEKQGGTIEADLDAYMAEIYVDEMQFTNVIFNLLDNALKYMKNDEAPKLKVSTTDINNDRQLEIRVSDNGIGIKKEDAKHIFEKFYRVSTGNLHDVKGFGLGLTYVKKMVEAFGGNIAVESEFGVGSTFVIQLPIANAE